MNQRLLSTEIKAYREKELESDNICPLCKKAIAIDEAALDHCHRTGRIRRPLHRWCNAVLGRIENWSKRGGWDNIEFLENIVLYLKSEHTDLIHPTHGKKRRKKNVKRNVKRKATTKKVVRSRDKRHLLRKRK